MGKKGIEKVMDEPKSKLPDNQLAVELVQKGISKLTNISKDAVSEFNTLSKRTVSDLGLADTVEILNQADAEEKAVRDISLMISSPNGLSKMALVTQVLLKMSGDDDRSNVRNAVQLLSWIKKEKELKFADKFNRFGSMADQVIPAALRAMKTPNDHWIEVKDLVVSGGGMKSLAEVFLNTPAEAVIEVVGKSLVHSLQLKQMSESIGRSKDDVIKISNSLGRVVEHRTQESRDRLKRFRVVEVRLQDYQRKLDNMKMIDEKGKDSANEEQMKELNALVRTGASIMEEYHRLRILVETDPMRIEEARMGLQHGFRFADSLARNQTRLENLSMQYRQNAMLRVYQLVLTLSTISSLYCDRTLAENRRMQLSIIKSCENTLNLVSQGKFDEALAEKPKLGLSPSSA